MSDVIDRANKLAEKNLQLNLQHQQQAGVTHPVFIEGLQSCRDCELPLSEARIQAQPNADRCVDCLSIAEQRRV